MVKAHYPTVILHCPRFDYTPGRGKIVPRNYYTPGRGKIVLRNVMYDYLRNGLQRF